jgi:hypothetical protein
VLEPVPGKVLAWAQELEPELVPVLGLESGRHNQH